MIQHFLITAVRYFLKQKAYSAINLFGLAVGLASVILIALWISDEVSFDNFNENKESIYQIYENQTYDGGQIYTFAATPGPLAENIKKDFPEIKETARTTWGDRLLFQVADKNIYETGIYGDAGLFNIFSFPIIAGDAHNPIPDNNSIAISEKMAKRYFGESSAVGKSFVVSGKLDVKVTAVFRDIPENSSLSFQYVLPFQKYLVDNKWLEDWGNNGIQTYLLLQPGADQKLLASKISDYVKKHKDHSVVDLLINPMRDWYLYKYDKGVKADGRILFVRIFAAVAIFILFIACINFMNMATARATLRMKEVGIRKVSGAQRRSIVFQFLGESVLTSFMALLLAILIAAILLPWFNDLTQKHITLPFGNIVFVAALIVVTVFTGVLAGSYPAFYLSGFDPAHVLKGKRDTTGGNFSLRKSLVVFQFFLSIILIICSMMIGKQVQYLRNKDLGFDRENVVSFFSTSSIAKNNEAFSNELLKQAGIVSIGRSTAQPYSIGSSTGGIDWDGKPKEATILFQVALCDYDFFPTVNIKFVAGRNFSRQNAADSSNFIITEEAARLMGMKEPLGQRLRWDSKDGQIIGVLRDFHAWDLHFGMQPVVFRLDPRESDHVFVKIAGANTEATVAAIGATWKKFESNYPFEFNFMDQQVEKLYRNEMTIGKLTTIFTLMAILISCMGLFALAAFTAERRTREIGIRKVLGATVPGLIISLCRDFLFLVIIAILIGIPMAWYLMTQFLKLYAFHTEMNIIVFVVAGACLLLIALLTVAWQAAKAASTNPTVSLRSE